MSDIKLRLEITALAYEDLKTYARQRAEAIARDAVKRAECIARELPDEGFGKSAEAYELAHAVIQLLSPRLVQCPTCRGHKKLCVDDYLQITSVCWKCHGKGEIKVTL